MPSPGGLQGTWCGECFLCLCIMVKHSVQGGRWLACSEDRSRLDSECMVLPSCSMLRTLSPAFSPTPSCPPIFQTLPLIWSGPSLGPDQTPMVYALAPPLCSVLSSDIQGCFLCVFVRGHPVPFLYSGNLWEGLGRGRGRGGGVGQIQESSGIPPLTPSFWGLPTRGSAHYFKL